MYIDCQTSEFITLLYLDIADWLGLGLLLCYLLHCIQLLLEHICGSSRLCINLALSKRVEAVNSHIA